MKLNPDDLSVTSFDTSASADAIGGPTGTYQPTPMTYCYWCPPKTIDTLQPVDTIIVG